MARIGFIGLGALGSAMARRVLALGHEAVGFNRSEARVAAMADSGLVPAASAKAACDADIVFSVLLNDDAARAVLVDGQPFSGRTGVTHVSVSTISVPLVRQIGAAHAAAGQGFVSAPLFGRPDDVLAGSAVLAVAGEAAAIDSCRDVLESFGRVDVIGSDPGAANAVKMAGNFLMASAVQSLREALALAEAAGANRQQFVDIVTTALFPTSFYQRFGALIATQGSNAPAINRFANSARLVDKTSHDLGVTAPLAGALAAALANTLE
ncbi:MAG: NAD(P)-binding domain-containing protein [Proteobacteria bacterium]|nr:NAD(P)-binding domain-containing protein [Pseudomonadota bacterium]